MAKKLKSINIDEKLWKAAKENTDNMSQLVQDLLEGWLGTNQLSKIEIKIEKLNAELSALNTKRIHLIKNKTDGSDEIYKKLRNIFFTRKRNEQSVGMKGDDKGWIKSDEIRKKINMLGVDPNNLLKELQREFTDLQARLNSEEMMSKKHSKRQNLNTNI